jgi:hypothetical protein
METDIKPTGDTAESGNKSKPLLCDVTLKYILKDFDERLKILESRKQTPITLGRINEIQLCICYFQQRLLDNIA